MEFTHLNSSLTREYIESSREKARNNPLLLDRHTRIKWKIRKNATKKDKKSWIPKDAWHTPYLIETLEGEYIENDECLLKRSCSDELLMRFLRNEYPECYRYIQKQRKQKELQDKINTKRAELGQSPNF